MFSRHGRGLEFDEAAVVAAVPASVQSLLTARTDRLSSGERAILQAAAVIGRRFAPSLLAAVTGSENVEASLSAMEDLDLVRHDANANEYDFKHGMVRDALYAGLLSGQREALHFTIAAEIEDRNAGRVNEVAETLAYHYARADEREKAVEYLAIVGRKSLGIYSLDEAEHALRTALVLARSDDGERIDTRIAAILVDLALAYYLQFRSAETVNLIDPELPRLETLGDSPQVAILLDLYGVGLFSSCRFREAKRMADSALAMAERLDDTRAKAHARAGVIMTSIFIDPMPLTEFESFARRAIEEAEQGEATYMVVRMTMVITLNYLHRGLTRTGQQWAYRLMQFGQDRQDLWSQGMALWLIGYSEIVLEDFTSALAHGEECMRTAFAPYDQQVGQNVAGIEQLLLGRVSEGTATLEGHRRHALDNSLQYAALTGCGKTQNTEGDCRVRNANTCHDCRGCGIGTALERVLAACSALGRNTGMAMPPRPTAWADVPGCRRWR
jgi:hypothetical protein